jgi:hypothetical protein
MSSEKRQTCALCQQNRLLWNSHIIPEFLYHPLYDDDIRRYNTFGQEGGPELGLAQKGEREYLLCDECEQRFAEYERFAAVFSVAQSRPFRIRRGLNSFAASRSSLRGATVNDSAV